MQSYKIYNAIFILLTVLFIPCKSSSPKLQKKVRNSNISHVNKLQEKLAKGWNTWNTKSVLSHVLLPEKLSINLQVKDKKTGNILKNALIGRRGKGVEHIHAGQHAYNGSYTDLMLKWHGMKLQIQSAHIDSDMVMLITPEKHTLKGNLLIHPTMIWGGKGKIMIKKDVAIARLEGKKIPIYTVGSSVKNIEEQNDYMKYSINQPVGISTGQDRSIDRIKKIINRAKEGLKKVSSTYGSLSDVFNGVHSILGWDEIYDPTTNRVMTPVSRIWNVRDGEGWVLFDWDTYFTAYMYALDDKNLAFANAIDITDEITKRGFIPNYALASGKKTYDRSEPPVGSFMVYKIYRQYPKKWFLKSVFKDLLRWNRWWNQHRQVNGYLCWGSNPYTVSGHTKGGKLRNAIYESGMDNSPMYDGATYDSTRHVMLIADVGLMSLYIKDCKSLARIAQILDKPAIVQKLKKRADKYTKLLQTLWSKKYGIFLNKNLATGKLSHRLSPTLFYPMLAGVATDKQAKEMIQKHFFNPKEFWGKWMIPSIARNDTAYHDNNYWRGRIWAPLNFLVYMGLKRYDNIPIIQKAKTDLVNKSKALLLRSWLSKGYIYENYNSRTGQGNDVENANKFYSWGALLGYISLIDKEQGMKPVK